MFLEQVYLQLWTNTKHWCGMAYFQRWRRNHAEAAALAAYASSENDSDEAGPRVREAAEASTSELSDSECCAESESYYLFSSVSEGDGYMTDGARSHGNEYNSEHQGLPQLLAAWTARHNITRCALNDLLGILRLLGHEVSKDARSILKTPRSITTLEKCGGQYIYLGLEKGILHRLYNADEYSGTVVQLLVNVDGLPLYRSSSLELWPIMCSFNNCKPFIVALYCGVGKPSGVEAYVENFLEEYERLSNEGIKYYGKTLKVNIMAFVCDAPARCMLKGIKGHTSYNACERCTIVGTRKDHRTVFTSHDVHVARNDDNFANFKYEAHQTMVSPLVKYNIPCVSSFSLDYMHLVCLGVVRRILFFWKSGPRHCRLSHSQLTEVSELLCALRLPPEFARQPRSLFEVERWKATEFRSFLLYTGPAMLKKVICKKSYETFMALSIAVGIMLEANAEESSIFRLCEEFTFLFCLQQ